MHRIKEKGCERERNGVVRDRKRNGEVSAQKKRKETVVNVYVCMYVCVCMRERGR